MCEKKITRWEFAVIFRDILNKNRHREIDKRLGK